MSEYAIIEKPFHPKRFEIHFRFHANYLEAIKRFKEGSLYNSKKTYALFDVNSTDNESEFRHITDF